MRKHLLAGALALAFLSLPGCATLDKIGTAFHTLTSAKVSPSAIVVAANTFNALEATATNYLRLVKCDGTNGPICRDPAITAKVIPLVRQGRAARDNLIAFMRTHPGELGDQGVYDALQLSISGIQAIVAQYGGKP